MEYEMAISMAKIPEIYVAISFQFLDNVDTSAITNELNKLGIEEIKIQHPRNESLICIDIAIVKNECFWELDDALSKMFSKVDHNLPQLKAIAKEYRGEIFIDIAFYQHGTYPSLVFHGENMKKICFLEANISIDPF